MKIFKFKIADVRHIENRFFGHNSAADCPISVKFCTGKQNSMVIEVTRHKMQILEIQQSRRPSFLSSRKIISIIWYSYMNPIWWKIQRKFR